MNPEFQRNLWLEFSRDRLLVVPAIVAMAVTATVGLLGRGAAVQFATFGAIAITLVWGSTQAGGSVTGEIAARTWDAQRASTLSAWQMTWGKLFGATAYAWYALAAVLIAWFVVDGWQSTTRVDWLLLLPAAVLAHGVALTASLYLTQEGRVHARNTRQAATLGVLAGLAGLQCLRLFDWSGRPHWFGWAFDPEVVAAVSLWFLAGWAVLGAWRAMAAALQTPARPWAWPTFLLAISVWLAGFMAGARGSPGSQLGLAFGFCWLATWLSALVDMKSPVRLRQWWQSGGGRFFMRAPAWVVGLPILIAAGAGAAAYDVGGPGPVRLIAMLSAVGSQIGVVLGPQDPWLTFGAAMLFLWRDVAIMYWAGLVGRGRRVPALVYLAALYVLVPAVLFVAGFTRLLPAVLPLSFPQGVGDVALWLLAVQALVATMIAAAAVMRLVRLTEEPAR